MKTGIFFLTLMIGIGLSWPAWGRPGSGQNRSGTN